MALRGIGASGVSVVSSVSIVGAFLALACERTPAPAQGYVPPDAAFVAQGACPTTDAGASVDVGSDDGPPGAMDDGGAGDDAAEAGEGGAARGPSAWVGAWTFVSGGSGVSCPDSINGAASTGELVITASAGGGLVVAEDACTFHFSVAGDTATSDCGQSCSAWEIPTIPEWTLTLEPDGSLEEKLGGRISENGETCTISGTSKLTRNAP